MELLEYMRRHGHEQLVMCSDPAVGLKAIIAIHDTTLGPASGGLRIWPYPMEEEAIQDVPRLARNMTYKAAAADLPLVGRQVGDYRRFPHPEDQGDAARLRALCGYPGRP